MDSDEVEGVKWDAWNRALAGIAGILAVGGRRDDGALSQTYDIAVELRERLRYSQGRLRSLKHELSVTVAAARSERHEAMARLQELETEVARLAGAVQAQGSTLAARETVSQSQAAENDQLRRHIAALERQLQRSEEDRRVTVSERNDALRHLEKMTQLLEESEGRVAEVQAEHNGLLGELVATKGRLADLSALETLYGAARDELQRLDKENLELKDMVASGGVQLGRSRILEALGIPDRDGGGAAEGSRSRRGGGGGGGRPSSPPAGLLGYGGGGGPGSGGSGSGRSRSAPRGGRRGGTSLPAGSTSGPLSPAGLLHVPSPPSHAHSHSHSPSLEDPVSEMAFLGPPSSAYPPDPENYVFYRVGGGYSAKLNLAQPTIPQPRGSGWVPKDVVRLVQAFRHSYGLCLEWRFWEPLVLMIDEVYRSRADGTLATMKAAQQEKLRAIKRQVRAALGYPNALANGKINYLQRQLNSARKVLAIGDRKGEQSLRQMAVKDYHLGYQLDRAVEENYSLRRSLENLEDLYNSALEGAERLRSSAVATSSPPPGVLPAAADGGGPAATAAAVAAAAAAIRRSATSDLYASALPSPKRVGSATAAATGAAAAAVTEQPPRLSPRRLYEHDSSQPHAHGPPPPQSPQTPQVQRARQSSASHAHAHAGDGDELWAQRRSNASSHHHHHHHHRERERQQDHHHHRNSQHNHHQHHHHRASEGTYSRRTSMMSAAPGGLDGAVDAFSLGS